jgi:hypothetical protein
MAIIKESIIGKHIVCEVKSSNIAKADYDTETKKLIVEFNNNLKYEYEDIPHQLFTSFRSSESQGSFFSKNIAKKYKYKKL